MSRFDPESAVRQQFVDAIIAALNTREGTGYGWHLTSLDSTGAITVATFETGVPLEGYETDDKGHTIRLYGPHRVEVTVTAASPR